jgi:hypothetical protein
MKGLFQWTLSFTVNQNHLGSFKNSIAEVTLQRSECLKVGTRHQYFLKLCRCFQ